ncbi:class I SAM-dependent methyltransferase [Streptomyces sp. ICBB 8177]|uniref:class I SAM-dependent methyltransferase n=1 Tax=Streptomyces sp. ICBB 8177 TaxID=563922 RepID=UPI000D67D211|nr:class I SAM-dependent methyltransferase [Streptomyces sp. ICBB 8177]PWI43411.1 SAM-dependent methyltransferase [Streptomyces sp. ICBB 8177]
MTSRETFDEVAEDYDRLRPRYPSALVTALVRRARLGPSSRVLEVGPGTGQLSVPLARLGGTLVAVELGAALARVARRNLAPHPGARVEVAAFENWPLPSEPFDAVVSATAFHWINPAVRLVKAADALAPGGTLALVTTHHVAGGTEPFFERVQRCYERWMPGTPAGLRLTDEREAATDTGELERSGRFRDVEVTAYAQEIAYSTREYLDLLLTYSNHRALPSGARRGLLECVGGLIEREFGGRVTKRYLHELITARRSA